MRRWLGVRTTQMVGIRHPIVALFMQNPRSTGKRALALHLRSTPVLVTTSRKTAKHWGSTGSSPLWPCCTLQGSQLL